MATHEVILRPAILASAEPTMQARIDATVAASCTARDAPMPPVDIALRSIHGRYLTALSGDNGWQIGQETELGPCGWFTQYDLGCGMVALKTCHERYITAPTHSETRARWALTQERELGDCGHFEMYDLGRDVALRTCAGRFWTPGDHTWEPDVQWTVVGETEDLMDWERLTVQLH
jgi:hypothetical protein